MKKIMFLLLWLFAIMAAAAFAAGSLEDDFLQDSSPEYEQMSTIQAEAKYDKCLSTPSQDLCREFVCEYERCTNINRWRDVQSGWCDSKMQTLTKCRKDTAEARLEQARARRERQKECDRVNEHFMQEYQSNNISVCRQLAGRNPDCSWSGEWARLFKCKTREDQFDAATKNKNLSRMRELKTAAEAQNCPWVGKAEGVLHAVHQAICQNKKGQFESHFKQKNISQCRTTISQSLTQPLSCDWVHDAEPRLNLLDSSLESFEAPPPPPLSECLSMEAAYHKALSDGNSAVCAMWLENAAGCSWRDKIVTQSEIPPLPTIGPAQDSPFGTFGGQYNDPDEDVGGDSPFATSGGQHSAPENIAEVTAPPPPSLSSRPDCRALEGNFKFAMTSGDINWARSVLANAESCSFHSAGQSMVCQILQGSFREALQHQNWSSAQASLMQGKNCRFASNGAGQIQAAQKAAECTEFKQKFNGLMAQGQYLLARNTLHQSSELGCTIPNADILALNQALAQLDEEYQQRAQRREDQQQALFNTVMSGMTAMAEMNQKRREEKKKQYTKASGNTFSGSSSAYNFPERKYAGQEAAPYAYSGGNAESASGSGSSGMCQGHRNAVYCGGQPVSGLVSLDTNRDGICDICKKSCKSGGRYIRGTATQPNCGTKTKTKTKKCQGHKFICDKNKKREGLALDVRGDGVCDICNGVVRIDRGGWTKSTYDASCKEVR